MPVTIGFDPGVRSPGIAIFVDDALVFATQIAEYKQRRKQAPIVRAVLQAQSCVKTIGEQLSTLGYPPIVFASEWPQIYNASKSKSDPNLLLPMLAQIGAVAGILSTEFAGVEFKQYVPHDWTLGTRKSDGTKSKASSRARLIAACLRKEEMQFFDGDDASDAMDAIGIGLYAIGRLRRPRKIFHE